MNLNKMLANFNLTIKTLRDLFRLSRGFLWNRGRSRQNENKNTFKIHLIVFVQTTFLHV